MRMHWPRRRRTRVALLALLALAVWCGYASYRLITARPGPPFAYAAAAEQLRDRSQGGRPAMPHQDAWPHLMRAVEVMEAAEAAAEALPRQAQLEPIADYYLLSDPSLGDYLDAEARRRVLTRTLRIVDAFEQNGGSEALADAARARFACAPIPQDDLNVDTRTLSKLRRLARLCTARMHRASEAGSGVRYARAFEQGLSIGRIVMQQPGFIHELVGSAISLHMLNPAREAALRNEIPGAARFDLIDAIDRQGALLPPVTFHIQARRLENLSLIPRLYTDNGRGNGRLILSAALPLARGLRASDPQREKPPATEWLAGKLQDSWAGHFVALAYPSRRQAIRRLDEFSARLEQVAAQPPFRRRDQDRSLAEWRRRLARRHIILESARLDLIALDSAVSLQAEHDGTRLVLALEIFRSRTGRYPAALAELCPGTLDALPIDPYSGEQYRYIPRASDGLPLLYSVGWDGTDDGGTQHPKGLSGAHEKHGTGIDFVLNRLPPPQPR